MKLAVDLHIHSGLSPCSDDDMTPNNVVGMAKLKGLDAIAVTDHNSLKNLWAFDIVAKKEGILLIPGVEITTKEDFHLLGLFKDISSAIEFQKILESHLPTLPNHSNVFGRQLLYNQFDEIIGEYSSLLLNATNLTVKKTIEAINNNNGVAIPAHIDRKSYSILSNLGFIPPNLEIYTVEISKLCDYSHLEKKHPYLKEYKKIINSDAHQLGDILERDFFIHVEEYSVVGIINELTNCEIR